MKFIIIYISKFIIYSLCNKIFLSCYKFIFVKWIILTTISLCKSNHLTR